MNNKKLLSFVLCFALLLSCIFFGNLPTAKGGTLATGYESHEPVTPPESDFTYITIPAANPTRAVITGYSGEETKIILPETLGGLPVTSINSVAFAKNKKITYVKLPSTLTGISGKVFNQCDALKELDICSENEVFSVIDGVLYRKETDKNSPNYGRIKSLVIFPAGKGGKFTVPYGVSAIGSYAFDNCYNLTEVNMYNTVTVISDNAFSYCWNLQNIRLSDNLTTMGKKALAYCESLTRIDLPSRLTSIGDDAVLGTIDSDDNKVYFFTDGISCAIGSYAHEYLINQALPESIIIEKDPSITHIDTGIKLIDPYDALPENAIIDIVVTPVEISRVEALFPTRYSKALAFDISFTQNGEPFAPKKNVILNFDGACDGAIPSASKVYIIRNNEAVLTSGSAHSPFIGAQVKSGGRFIILANDDFSLKGDIDGDGIVTLFDVRAALHASTGTLTLTPEQKAAANVDKSADGKITTKDARIILRLAGGMKN